MFSRIHFPKPRPRRSTLHASVALLVSFALVVFFPAQALAADGDPAACTPSDRSSAFTGVSITPSADVAPGSTVKLDYTGTVPQDVCAGDWANLIVPEPLALDGGNTVKVTFDDPAAAGKSFSNGVSAIVSKEAEAGKTYALVFNDGLSSTLTIAAAPEPAPAPDPAPTDTSTTRPAPATAQPASPAAAAACTPSDRGDTVEHVEVSGASNHMSAPDGMSIFFDGLLPEGGCAGDYVEIRLPDELVAKLGSTEIDVRDPDGVLLGTMTIASDSAKIVFNDYVETHIDVTYHGLLRVQFGPSVVADTPYHVEYVVGTVAQHIDFMVQGSAPTPDKPVKRAFFFDDNTKIRSTITTGTTRSVGEHIVITDDLDDVDASHLGSQTIDCDSLDLARLGVAGAVPFTVESCTPDKVTISFDAPDEGVQYVFSVQAFVAQPVIHNTNYGDKARVVQDGVEQSTGIGIGLVDSGAGGDGETPVPSIDLEKYSTSEGVVEGDHDTTEKALQPGADEPISFTVTNNGQDPLGHVVVSDSTTAGSGTLTGLTCDFSALGGPSSGTTWDGPFGVGESFNCAGVLPALDEGVQHTDLATVAATGVISKTPVSDQDPWMGSTPTVPKNPAINIEKWSSDEGQSAGDHDSEAKLLEVGVDEAISFTITNTGDLEAMERAEAYGALRGQGLSIADISRRSGIGSATISNYLSLLLLSEEDKELVRAGKLAPFAAIAAARRRRQAERKLAGATRLGRPPKNAPDKAWFGERHPLAPRVRERCIHSDLTGPLWQLEFGCGPCWEAVIREDALAGED